MCKPERSRVKNGLLNVTQSITAAFGFYDGGKYGFIPSTMVGANALLLDLNFLRNPAVNLSDHLFAAFGSAPRSTLTVCLVIQETIVWLDALYIAKKPLAIVCYPIGDIDYRRRAIPLFDPTGLGLPLRVSLYPSDLFTAESFFLSEQLISLSMCHSGRCIFTKKSGAWMNGSCWY